MLDKKKSYDYAVFIGRFQPLHKGHMKVISKSLEIANKLFLVIGSDRTAPSFRCPWSSDQRINIIKQCIPKIHLKKITFILVRDAFHDEKLWKNLILNEIHKNTEKNSKITLIGHIKDKSSYYLKNFSCWNFIEIENYKNINSTDIRKQFFFEKNLEKIKPNVPSPVWKFLNNLSKKEEFQNYIKEFENVSKINDYSTTRVYIIRQKYFILVKKEKTNLTKPLYSLPNEKIDPTEKNYNWLNFLEENVSNEIDFKQYYKKEKKYPNPLKEEAENVCIFFKIPDEMMNIKINNEEFEWLFLEDLYSKEKVFSENHHQLILHFLYHETF